MADASSNTEFPDMAYITTPLVKVCGLASAVNVLKYVMLTLISIIMSLKCILLLLKSIYCWLHLYFKYKSVMFQQGRGVQINNVTTRALPLIHCYHGFYNSTIAYLFKKHHLTYSPRMIPKAQILQSGSRTITPLSVKWVK